MEALKDVTLNFNQDSLLVLNISLGFIMFGIALDLNLNDFKRIIRKPKPVLIGVFSQFLMMPLLTFLLVLIWKPAGILALGMFLVAACPGGNVSNFMTHTARGNTALSIVLTTIMTIAATFMTPLNFQLYAGFYEPSASLLKEISVNAWEMFRTILLLIGIPLALGILASTFLPKFVSKIKKPVSWLSMLIFGGFVIGALVKNHENFLKYFHVVALLVLVHNALAFLGGYGLGRIFKLERKNITAITIETGIQNSALGLVIIFNFFDGMGGMALIVAWWGVWHLFSGMGLAMLFRWINKPKAQLEG